MQYSGGLTPRPGSPSSRYSLVPPELYQWTQVNPHALWLYPNIVVQDSCGRLRDRMGFFDSCHQISSKQKVLCDQSQMLILTVHIANCPFHDSDYRCNVRPHNCVWRRASTPFSLGNSAYLIGILSSLHRRHSPSFCGLLEPEAAFPFFWGELPLSGQTAWSGVKEMTSLTKLLVLSAVSSLLQGQLWLWTSSVEPVEFSSERCISVLLGSERSSLVNSRPWFWESSDPSSHHTGTPLPPYMFKLVQYEALAFGKRVVCFLLEWFLVSAKCGIILVKKWHLYL